MSSIITSAKEFRAEVLRGDRDMLRQLSSAYSLIDRRLRADLNALTRDIAEAQRQGKTVNRDWLRRSLRYQSLIRQVQAEIANYSNGVSRFIETKQQQAIQLGQSHAVDLIQTALPDISFARLPTEAISELVGVMQDGSPLSKALDKLGAEAARDIREALITGLASGHGVHKIAQSIRQAIDVPRWKALQISRTSVLNAYRSATLQTYLENSDVIGSWTWISAQSLRTCPSCWALHGKVFPVTTTFFPNHVSCRCTSIPNIRGEKSNVQSGTVLFRELPISQQQEILGPGRFEMWANGEIDSLMEFTMLTRDKQWGPSYQVRPLYQLKKRRAA
jgi:SPP1 gp7 family putative phage head morphogenesis protein